MRILALLLIVFLAGLTVSTAADAEKGGGHTVVLKCIRSDGDDLVEVSFGDVRLVTAELSFMHDDGSKTNVRSKDGNVELKSSIGRMFAKEISFTDRNGAFGRRGPKASIEKSNEKK
jgi:hypothetical protein